MVRSSAWLLTAVLLAMAPAYAADVRVVLPVPGPALVQAPPPVIVEMPDAEAGPLIPPPQVRYGCKRVWRCDATVCEWRRGCWGVYGYVEGPYYTSAFARRQWQAHGLPASPYDRRHRR